MESHKLLYGLNGVFRTRTLTKQSWHLPSWSSIDS